MPLNSIQNYAFEAICGIKTITICSGAGSASDASWFVEKNAARAGNQLGLS
jgi:hypothetical protein